MRVLRWALVLLGVAWGLILLAWLVLQWAILPHIDDWRPRVEAEASRQLGTKVQIGAMQVTAGGISPRLELSEVRLLDPTGRPALSLPKVTAVISPRSIFTFSLKLEQLVIDGPQLEVRRDGTGRIFVAGLSMQGDANTTADASQVQAFNDWFFSQTEFAIRHGRIRWVDEQRQAAPLELSDLNLVLRNSLRHHDMRLDATPPEAWGQRFSLRGRFTQKLLKRPGDLRFWSGQLFAELPRADLRELRRYVDLPFELNEGDGALRAWVDLQQGQPQSVTLDMGLRAVKLRLNAKAEQLELEHIEGRLQLSRDAKTLSLKATQLGFKGADGLDWPRSNWGVSLQLSNTQTDQLDKAKLLGGEVAAERLDFGLMASIAERLPIGTAPREWLDQLDPQGVVSNLKASWKGPLEAPLTYRVQASLQGLSAEPRESTHPDGSPGIGRPGLSGASVQLDANEKGGSAQLQIEKGHVDVPGLFEDAELPIDHLAAQLQWKIEGSPARVEVKVGALEIRNPDLRGRFEGQWHSVANKPAGWMELTGRIERVDAERVQRYLPVWLTDTRSYLKRALHGGRAENVNVLVRGELDRFPFDAPVAIKAGEQFRITADARTVGLSYVPPDVAGHTPPWPPFEQIDAGLVFERAGMQIVNGRARALGYELYGINGGIKDFSHHQAVLTLDGNGRGPLQELLAFMHASPLDEWTGHGLAQATGSGNAGLKLSVALMLSDMNRSAVKGSLLLAGNELRIRPDAPLMSNARAKIDFDTKGVQVTGGQARVVGGDASFDGGTQKDGSLRFTASGTATAEALRRANELGIVARVAHSATGQAAYKLQLAFPSSAQGGGMDLSVASNLVGLALNLPAPLNKDADTNLPLAVRITPQGTNRDELRVELGKLFAMQYQRDTSGDTAKVLRGAVALQDALPTLPQSGVLGQARIGTLNVDAWLTQFGGGGGAGSGNSSDALDSGYMPESIELKAQSVLLTGRTLRNLSGTVGRVSYGNGMSGWSLKVDAEQLAGRIELQLARSGQLARVHARLSRLSIPKQEVDSVTELLDRGLEHEAGQVPALDIVAEEFELKGKKLGKLEIDAQSSGAARDWRLARLSVSNPDGRLAATGNWSAKAGGPRRTELDWTLDVYDAGKLLQRMGMGEVLRRGKGQLTGHLGWTGSPMALDFPSMTGSLKLQLDAGQFLKAEPGVGRLLGVLSLQSLPRRLLFDFRDVFSEGFAFDGVTGDVAVARGVASSANLKVKGVQAAVLIDGRTDLAAETQDLRVVVIPEINAGGASLAYAAINPAIGLGTFLAQLLLSKPMAEAGTREFHITGTWDDPKVEKLESPRAEATAAPQEGKQR
ncbi:YhdP family protein [Burkholderiaceae bacterium UC74_6]